MVTTLLAVSASHCPCVRHLLTCQQWFLVTTGGNPLFRALCVTVQGNTWVEEKKSGVEFSRKVWVAWGQNSILKGKRLSLYMSVPPAQPPTGAWHTFACLNKACAAGF